MNDSVGQEVTISVVSPFYNEQEVIAESAAKLIEAIQALGVRWELLLVNDGSRDDSLARAEGAVADEPRARVLSYAVNRGRGYALRTGIAASRGHYVITTESDLTWGKDIIAKLLEALRNTGADIVIASPYAKGGRLENVPFKRALLSRLGNIILRRTVSSDITMLSGMTRGYLGGQIRSLPLEEDRKEIHLEIVSKACMLNWQFAEIPAILRWEPPKEGAPKRQSKFRAGRLIRSHLLFGLFEAPILLFGSAGLVLLLAGGLLGCYLFVLHVIIGETIGDRVALILSTIFLIISGLSMFLFGFLSYQIKALQREMLRVRHDYRTKNDTTEPGTSDPE